jgi:CubicO group peptidase (beta-lactamase class C family)
VILHGRRRRGAPRRYGSLTICREELSGFSRDRCSCCVRFWIRIVLASLVDHACDRAHDLLVLNDGVRNGAPIIPAAWLSEATAFDLTNQEATYGLGWWIDPTTGSIRAEGSDCQFLWLDPVEDTVIVRLGRSCGDVDWLAVFQQITTG